MMNKYKEIFDEQVAKTVDFLKHGKTILYPTDTIWGLGCDATDANAVNQIYKIKMRPPQKSMIILIDVVDRLFDYVTNVPPMAVDLVNIVRKPLSVIYPNAKNLRKTYCLNLRQHNGQPDPDALQRNKPDHHQKRGLRG